MEVFFIVGVNGQVASGPYPVYGPAEADAKGPGVPIGARPVKLEKFFFCDPVNAEDPYCPECLRVIRERNLIGTLPHKS